MKLHTVFVTHNRLELTKRTIESYRATVTLPHTIWVVDNASDDGTADWILEQEFAGFSLLDVNRYPGFATNLGFSHTPSDATHLHRSDNDVEYLAGWCEEVVARFEDPKLGQLGLRTEEEEGLHANVGGNCVIPRSLFNQGLRYSESPWTQMAFEDGQFSHEVYRRLLKVERVQRPCIEHIGLASREDRYYQKTFSERGITFEQYGIGG